MSLRSKTLVVLTAAAAVSSAASAQTYTFTQTELGRIVPARFATTTQALMANVDVAVAPSIVPEVASSEIRDDAAAAASLAGEEVSTWNALSSVDENGDEKKEENESGFFSSTMGRASIVGLAGLAGASYFALRSDAAPLSEQKLFDTASNTATEAPAFTENPEPATIVLMATGLLGIGVVARRRRAN